MILNSDTVIERVRENILFLIKMKILVQTTKVTADNLSEQKDRKIEFKMLHCGPRWMWIEYIITHITHKMIVWGRKIRGCSIRPPPPTTLLGVNFYSFTELLTVSAPTYMSGNDFGTLLVTRTTFKIHGGRQMDCVGSAGTLCPVNAPYIGQ